jgi:hypothetical protein
MSQPTSIIIIIAGALVAVHHAGDTLRRCGHLDTPLASFSIVIVSSISAFMGLAQQLRGPSYDKT